MLIQIKMASDYLRKLNYMKVSSIILAEDSPTAEKGLQFSLKKREDVELIAHVGQARDVLHLLDTGATVDVVVSGLQLPGQDGLFLAREIKKRTLGTAVVIIAPFRRAQEVAEALSAGVMGCLLRNVGIAELVFAVSQAKLGHKYISSALTFQYMKQMTQQQETTKIGSPDQFRFSSQEIEVLNLIAEGLTNNEISDRLFLSKRTVERQRQTLIEKTNARNTAALIRYAVRNGLLNS